MMHHLVDWVITTHTWNISCNIAQDLAKMAQKTVAPVGTFSFTNKTISALHTNLYCREISLAWHPILTIKDTHLDLNLLLFSEETLTSVCRVSI